LPGEGSFEDERVAVAVAERVGVSVPRAVGEGAAEAAEKGECAGEREAGGEALPDPLRLLVDVALALEETVAR
jgi:hypothetical protein